jgi:hypothetical protein
MKATTPDDGHGLRLEADTPEEAALLAHAGRLAYLHGLAYGHAQRGWLELRPGRAARSRHALTVVALELARAIGRQGPDWCVAVGLTALSWWVLGLASGLTGRVVMGLALLAFTAAGGLIFLASLRGIRPQATTKRWARWAYYYGAACLVVGATAAFGASVLWLALVFGALAQRVTP